MISEKSAHRMLTGSWNDKHKIANFPGPFHCDFTPYSKYDFSSETKQKCATMNEQELGDLRICKVIIIGDVSVGKTCLVNSFCYKMFDTNYKSTIGVDFEVGKFNILNVPLTLQIWDTAGQERFRSITQSYYRNAKAIVIVFDFSHMSSLHNCKLWLKDALHTYSTVPFLFLVGTKKDVISSSAYSNMETIGASVAQKLKAEFWPVSAKTGENIDDLFFRITTLVFDEMICKECELVPCNVPIGTELIVLKKKKGERTRKFRNVCNNQCNFS